jgi:DNA-binding response OmpR family regulator
MKILLVEDDNLTIESVKLCMEFYENGSKLVTVDKGKEAVQLLQNDHFDAVIIDLGLPDIDGMEVLEQVRRFSDVPAIVLTARHNIESRTKAEETGADEFITKPFDYRLLLASLHRILDDNREKKV